MIGLDSFTKQILNVWPQYEFKPVFDLSVLLKSAKLQHFSLAVFARFIRVTNEALMMFPNTRMGPAFSPFSEASLNCFKTFQNK